MQIATTHEGRLHEHSDLLARLERTTRRSPRPAERPAVRARRQIADALAAHTIAVVGARACSSYGDGPSDEIPAILDRLAKPVLPRHLAAKASDDGEAGDSALAA